MRFTGEQIRAAYKKLHPDIQDLVGSMVIGDLIMQLLVGTGLSEEQANDADTEILHAMYGLQTVSDAIDEIAQLSNKSPDDLSRLKSVLEEFVFSRLRR